MKLLVVEDFDGIADAIAMHVAKNCPGGQCSVARAADEAVLMLDQGPYDLIICDRKIPDVTGSLDISDLHGDGVLQVARTRFPGTPLIVFTAHHSIKLFSDLVREARQGDPFGERRSRPLLQVMEKVDLESCLAEVSRVAREVAALEQVELDFLPVKAAQRLRSSERRILKIFARQRQGRLVHVQPIGGGLSDTSTFRVSVEDAHGSVRANSFAKIGQLPLLEAELKGYSEFLPAILPGGSYTPFADRVETGSGDVGGLFYTLANEYDASLYQRLVAAPAQAADLVERVAQATEPWYRAGRRGELTVREIRRGLIRDDQAGRHAEPLLGAEVWRAVEDYPVSVVRAPQHGDLHGQNVLVSPAGEVVLVDYGDLRRAHAGLDFVVLELSLLFHPENVTAAWGWPQDAQAAAWTTLDEYVSGCPGETFVRGCREVAKRRAVAQREIYAVAYAYCLRQLKYPDTNKGLAEAILRSAVAALLET